jgi:hypothetical protein
MIKPMTLDADARARLRAAASAVTEARASGQPYAICNSLRQLARLQAGALLLSQAEAGLRQSLRWAHAGLGTDLQVDILCDLCDLTDLWSQAEDQLPPGEAEDESEGDAVRERTRAYVLQACELAPAMSEREAEGRVMLRLSSVVGRCGEEDLQHWLLHRAQLLLTTPRPNPLSA